MHRAVLATAWILTGFLFSHAGWAQEAPLVGRVMPFELDYATASSMYENGLHMAQVNVWVAGGTAGDWVATGIAIAEAAATGESVDSVKVTVRNANVQYLDPEPGLALLARVYFSPDPQRSVWADLGLAAEYATNVRGEREIRIQQFYQSTLVFLLDGGVEFYEADIAAAKVTIKEFGMTGELQVPGPNSMSSEKPRASFAIEGSLLPEPRALLSECLANPYSQLNWGCSKTK